MTDLERGIFLLLLISTMTDLERGIFLLLLRQALPEPTRSQPAAMADEGAIAELDVRTWLDTQVRNGWGAKWALAFENVGHELVEDLLAAADNELDDVRQELENMGARSGHLRKIMGCVQALRSGTPFPGTWR